MPRLVFQKPPWQFLRLFLIGSAIMYLLAVPLLLLLKGHVWFLSTGPIAELVYGPAITILSILVIILVFCSVRFERARK